MQKFKRGFTLLEIIVVIGIIVILSGIFIGFSQESRNQIMLNVEKARVVNLFSRAKSFALTGYTNPPSLPPPCSYGVKFSSSSYTLFEYTPPAPESCDDIESITSIVLIGIREAEKTDFNSKIKIDSASADSLGYIVFIPPNLLTKLFDQNGNEMSAPAKIYLKTVNGSATSEIVVSSLGQINL